MRKAPLAFAAVLAVSAVAWARSAITTPAGCNSEFGHGSSMTKSCTACVKGGGTFRQHAAKKGVWACE
jgi:hypothetical protein